MSRKHLVRLASNETPFGLPAVLASRLSAELERSNQYPDPDATALITRLADKHDVPTARVVAGCGSVQLLQELIAATCDAGDEVAFPWRSFEAYPTLARIAGARPRPVPLRGANIDLPGILGTITEKTSLVILCSPNNPIGPSLAEADVRKFLDEVPPDVVVALDEAYIEYVRDANAVDGRRLLDDFSNTITLRTFSKAYGLAGLRVGYALTASAALADRLRQVHLPYSVSSLAQAAALAVLEDERRISEQTESTVAERDTLRRSLGLLGWHVPASQGNFVWLPAGDRSESLSSHLAQRGILTRCFAGEGVRITVGDRSDNVRLMRVLSSYR